VHFLGLFSELLKSLAKMHFCWKNSRKSAFLGLFSELFGSVEKVQFF
jgi:hypothetical protein